MEGKCVLQKSWKTRKNPPHVSLVDIHEENPDLSKCVAGKHKRAVTDFFQIAVCVLWCI